MIGLRRARRSAALLLLALLLAGCRKSSAAAPVAPDPVSGSALTGTTVDGVSSQPVAGAAIHVEGAGDGTSAGDGAFAITTPQAPATRPVTIRSSSTVDRLTWLTTPGPAGTLPLMPLSLGLAAFDEMFRSNQGSLRRWTTAPRLIILRQSLVFTSVNDATFAATSTMLTDVEVNGLADDLTLALPQLTGGMFSAFASVATEDAAAGDLVPVARTGAVFVARYSGLTAGSTFSGYTRWSWNGSGQVVMGTIMLDQHFETSGSPFRRSLRSHELGHALGYNHVTGRASVMNPTGTIQPNTFDRDGARIAFLRPLLNRSPDADPDPRSLTALASARLFTRGAP